TARPGPTGASCTAARATGACKASARTTGTTGTTGTTYSAYADPAKVALANGRVPQRLDLTRFFIGRDTIVDHNVGIGHTANGAILVAEHRTRPARLTTEIGGPFPLDGREMYRHRVFETQALYRVFSTNTETGVHEI